MQREKKIHFGIRKYAVGVLSVAVSVGFLGIQSARVAAEEVVADTSTTQELQSVETSTPQEELNPAVDDAGASESQTGLAGLVSGETGENQSLENSVVAEDVTELPRETVPVTEMTEEEGEGNQPLQPQYSSRMARSAVDQTVTASLPLDENGQLITSVSSQPVVQVQEVYADGSSQIVAATASNTAGFKADADNASLAASLVAELQAINYEDLYSGLKHQERFLDGFAIEQELRKEKNGQTPTAEEIAARKRQVYMNQLDMGENFAQVQANIETILAGVFEKSATVNVDELRANKEKILLGLTYLDRQYGFQFGNLPAKDLILYYPDVFGNRNEPLANLLAIGDLTYADLELKNNLATYQKKIAPITQKTDIIQFIESQVPRWTGEQDVSTWFRETSKAYIVESTSPHSETALYSKLRNSTRLKNHLLPLLNLSDDSLYAISTTNTITYGAVDTYLASKTDSNRETLKNQLEYYAEHQQEFLDFWYRISEQKERLRTYEPIVVTDSLQAYSTGGTSVEQLWSSKSGAKALTGVQEFIGPMNLHMNFVRAGGQANGDSGITLFLYKALTDDGQSVYTHELTHILDNKVWFNGYGRRTGQGAEVFARGLFEAHNNTIGTAYAPMFNLNTAYSLGENRTQNQSPQRFQTEEDLKVYMQGILDVVYSLDYLEAQAILQQTAEERAVLLNQLTLIPDEDGKRPNQVKDQFSHITADLAASLTTIDDFVDNRLVSGRLAFKGMDTTGIAKPNDYHVVPLFEPIFAGVQNNPGSAGDVSFRRYAYEILGEYGYKDGMVAYLSNQYDTDAAALAAIMPEYNGDLATFKKAMYARRAERLADLKTTSQFTDLADLEAKMNQAVEQDLLQMQANQRNGNYLTNSVTAVRSLKTQIFQDYLAMTDEFRTSIYKESQTNQTFYVTNGPENSTDGDGTEANPYHSLSYALQQASDGDSIKLVKDVQHRQDQPFVIDKAVTIDGQGHSLSFWGADLELQADVIFANMNLRMIPDGSKQPTIYLSGHKATFDTVSTTVSQAQDSLRPTIVAGARTGDSLGNHAQLLVVNGDSNTRFHQIFAGNADSPSYIPVDIIIDSEFAGVDEGIDLGGQNGQPTFGRVQLLTTSSQLKKVTGTNSMDNQVTVKAVRLYGAQFTDIQDLHLVENADVTLANQVERIVGQVNIESGSKLQLPNGAELQVGGLSGAGVLSLLASNVLTVTGDLTGTVQIAISDFEQNLAKQVEKILVTVEGLTEQANAVRLVNDYGQYILAEENGRYRLVRQSQTQVLHTVTLQFVQDGQVLKSEQVQVVDGQSLENVEAYLPQASTGYYQVSPSFDSSVLMGISTSQTIAIPVVLVIPATPILSFDKRSIQELTLVQGLDKSRYQEGETLDLTGLRVRLVDHQGISLTLEAAHFTDYGISASPVGTPLLSSHQAVTLTLGNHVLSLPIQVQAQTPSKADRFQPLVSTEVIVWPTDSQQTKDEQVLQAISLPDEAGSVHLEVVGTLPRVSGDYTATVRVTYDDQSWEEVGVPLHILSIDKGTGATHELPEGVLPPLETAKGTGTTHELPEGTLPPLETAKGTGVTHEMPEGVLPPLETAKGTGATHELPVGVLPPLETAKGTGTTHELPEGVLPPLETAKGTGTTHEMPEGTLPPLETAKGLGVTHELAEGVLPTDGRESVTVMGVAQVSPGKVQAQLPKTGQSLSLYLYGIGLALLGTVFFHKRPRQKE